jgi:hypothetical protein
MSNTTLPRIGRAGLAAGSVLVLAAFLVGGAVGEWLFAALAGLFPVFLVAQARARPGGSRGRLITLLTLAALLEIGLLGVLALRADTESWIGGLPASTLLMIATLGVGCLVVTTSAYAVLFDPKADGRGRDR